MWRCSNIPLSPTHDFFLQFLKYHCSQSYRPFYLLFTYVYRNVYKALTNHSQEHFKDPHSQESLFGGKTSLFNINFQLLRGVEQSVLCSSVHSFFHPFIHSKLGLAGVQVGECQVCNRLGLLCVVSCLLYSFMG